MKISIDTKEDTHEEIRKAIKMLQNLVGDSQEVFTNQPESQESEASPMDNIFGDIAAQPQESASVAAQTAQETTEEASQSTEDLFAELFSEEELKKMETSNPKDQEEEKEIKAKSKKYDIEFF